MRYFLLGLCLLWACPGKSEHQPSALPPCTSFGQTCEFSPGKLGSCVQRDGCTQGNCFVCQSQH
ncbi:MAG TPA: hypothetical protein VGM29_18675 [Polyangiaceae bacterium]